MKRRKTIRAGQLVWDTVYTIPRPRASEAERSRIREVTAAQVARTNCNTAQRKLELLMAANFAPSDIVITPTFRDADLPADLEIARRRLGRVLSQVRAYRRARGLPELMYIYVPEGRHGDHRIHFHIVMNATGDDLELFRSLWQWGSDVQLNYIHERGYDGWAGYLTKERRISPLNGKKQWVSSRNLKKPVITYGWVDDGASVDAPPGAKVLDEGGGRNEIASCKYIKYMLPQAAHRARVFSGLEWSVTNKSRREKKRKRSGQTAKTTVC